LNDSEIIEEIKQRPTVEEFRRVSMATGAGGAAKKYGIPLWKAESLAVKYGIPRHTTQPEPLPTSTQATNPPTLSALNASGAPQRVVVTDINMSFGSMVEFMVKWAIASIPALIILCAIVFGVMVVLAGIAGIAK